MDRIGVVIVEDIMLWVFLACSLVLWVCAALMLFVMFAIRHVGRRDWRGGIEIVITSALGSFGAMCCFVFLR